jgi:hypothetical protein
MMKIGTNYWDIGWGGGAADPFRNGYQNVSGPDPWRQDFLDETAFYTAHRFMDWNQTNGSTQVHWADRTQKGDSNQRTVAYEWMCDLCNRHKADAWITVPHRTYEEPAYWTNLAILVLEQLDPTLKLYIEYSNETWNFIFGQAEYCREQGVALNLDSAEYTAGFKFHVYAAVRLFERFDAVWGAGNARLVKVIAGQAVNTWMTGKHLEALADPRINPSGVQADAYGIAPYFGNGASTIEEAGEAVQTGIDRTAAQAEAVAGSGLRLIAYEGGQHLLGNADVVSRDPQIYDHYLTYLRGIEPYLDDFAHYNHSSSYRSGGAWGAKEGIGQPIEQAHKYRALWDYAGASPQPDERVLVPFDALWRFSIEPSDGWIELDFDDGSWDMQESDDEPAVYLRRTFVNNLQGADRLRLTVRHEHRFVAYLNGTEILSVTAGTSAAAYQLDQHAHLLRSGDNVLAIKLYVDQIDKTDLSVNPELWAARSLTL